MSGEWKAGDVAMVLNEWGVWNRAIRVVGRPDFWEYGVSQSTAPTDADARPLVVIDPEDAEQVERLAVLLWPHYDKCENARLRKSEITADALREFAAPTPPKPDEPQGLGAVVEDAEGERWVRTNAVPYRWLHASTDEAGDDYYDECGWSDIARRPGDVRVLSEGVTS